MSKHASPAVIGGFVVAAFALLVTGILLFGGARYFHETVPVIVYFDGSVAGLRVGAPVKFRGITIGTVKSMRIDVMGAVDDPEHITIPVILEIDQDLLASHGVTGIDLNDRERWRTLVARGLRAQLASESFVTGVLYVALDVKPEMPARLMNDPDYPEIPTVRSLREAIPSKIEQVLTNIADVNFPKLASSMETTIASANTLLTSPDLARAVARLDEVTKQVSELTTNLNASARELGPAATELKSAAASASMLLAPAGEFARQLDRTLREIEVAARSARRLGDQLARDPGAIVRGGKQ
jgi:paraquat-inducible protein B